MAVAWALAGCATPPPAVRPVVQAAPVPVAPPPAPMIEYPPIESVEPPVIAAPAPVRTPPDAATLPAPETEPVVAPVPTAPAEPTDDQQLASVLADLQRYGAMQGEDVRRELNTVTQTLARQRNDYNRVRLAVLYTLAKTTPQDDQRALQLLDTVAKSNPGPSAVKQLASVLQSQIAERSRAVRDEQQKAEAAIKKLEALRTMERDLLRDRIRGGGGGSSGGGSSGGGGGGGGGS
jgi:hypothetical protein